MLPSLSKENQKNLSTFLQSNQRRLLAKDIMVISDEMDDFIEPLPESAINSHAASNASSPATLNNINLPRTSPLSNRTTKKSFPSKTANSSWITEPDEQEHQQHLTSAFPFRDDQSVIYDLELKMEKLKQQIDDSKQENAQLHKAKKELLRRIDELEKKLDHSQSENAILKKHNAENKKNIEITKARINEMKSVLKDSEEKINEQNNDIHSRNSEINKLHKLQNLVQSEHDKLYAEFVALSEAFAKLQQENSAMSEDLHNISLDNQILKEQIENHQHAEQEPEQFEVLGGTGEILGDILNDKENIKHGKGVQCSEVYDEQIKMFLNLVDEINGYIINIKTSSTLIQPFKEANPATSNSDSVETVLSKLHHIKNNVSIISMEEPELVDDPDISVPQPNLTSDGLLLEATDEPSPALSTQDMLLTLPNLRTPTQSPTNFEFDKESFEKTKLTRPVLRNSQPKNMLVGAHFVLLMIGILIGFALNGWNMEYDEYYEDYGYSFFRESFDGVTPM